MCIRDSPSRRLGIAAAFAVAAGSLAVLAMIGRSSRRDSAPSVHTKQSASVDAPSSASDGDLATMSTASAVSPQIKYAPGTIVDRKRRDAVRAELVPPLIAQGVEGDPHTGLTIPAGASGPSHNLSKEYLQARIREDFFPLARACYETALAKQPTLRGRIVIDFMIVGDAKSGGIVDQAKVNERTDIADAEFATCMRESMLSMVFAPPENNGWITVTYPFVFSPEDDDESSHDN